MGNTIGPMSSVELRMRALQGQITADTPVAKDFPDKWSRADKVSGLMAISFGERNTFSESQNPSSNSNTSH